MVEQNRDAQMLGILRAELPHLATRCQSVLSYDGLPLDAEVVVEHIERLEAERGGRR